MKFLLQCNNKGFIDSVEQLELYHILNNSRLHEYELCNKPVSDEKDFSKYIPVGDIKFVETHLKHYHGVEQMNPIEIPRELRKPEFLGRYYRVYNKKNLPKNGFYFLKGVDRLKDFSTQCVMGMYDFQSELYVVSSIVGIKSEWRVFVCNGIVEGVAYYKGNPLLYPDRQFIHNVVNECEKIEWFPRAYTIDIAVTDNGPVLLELHNFCCVGTYGFTEDCVTTMYNYGYEYCKNINKKIETSEV